MRVRFLAVLVMTLLLGGGASAASDGNSALKEALARRHATITKPAPAPVKVTAPASAKSATPASTEASPSAPAEVAAPAPVNTPTPAPTETPAAPAGGTSATTEERTAPPAAETGSAAPAPAAANTAETATTPPAAGTSHAEAEHPPATGPQAVWEDLLQGNQRFVMGEPQPRLLISSRQRLVYGQQPKAIILTCSDSRVSPELIFDKGLGDIFVVRTAGNVADPVALGSIEYAAEHLHAGLLVILGHENCGAVAAAASGEKMPSPNLEAIVSKIKPAIEKTRGWATGDELIHRGVIGNIHQSARDVIANSPLVRESIADGKLVVVKAVYDLKTGEVTTLPEANSL
jgi:carbonic anhydrase